MRGDVVPVVISVYKDKSFDFIMKQPPVAELIKKALNIKAGSQTSGPMTKHAVITEAQLKEIAERKAESHCSLIEAAMKTVGTARAWASSSKLKLPLPDHLSGSGKADHSDKSNLMPWESVRRVSGKTP